MAQYTDVMFFEVICVSLLTSAALFRQMSFNFMTLCLQCFWCCWLGDRKGLRPVKKWVVGCWHGYLSGLWSEMQTCIWPSWCHGHSLSLAWVKSRLVLPFCYRLTRVVLDKGPLNSVCSFERHVFAFLLLCCCATETLSCKHASCCFWWPCSGEA